MGEEAKRERDKATGQYAHEGRWDRPCKCGHTLGQHTAAKVAGERPCIAGDFDPSVRCDCRCFKPKWPAAKVPRRPADT